MLMINAIIDKLSSELTMAIAASQQAHQTATDKQNIPENKYDTLALEAAYLAHGQSLRIAELQKALHTYKNFKPPIFDDNSEVALGAQVSLRSNDGVIGHYFIGPCSGGLSIRCQADCRSDGILTAESTHYTLQVLTPQAPLGQSIMGRYLEDEIQIQLQGEKHRYEIIAIL